MVKNIPTIDPEFEQAAYTEFVAVMRDEGLVAFRGVVRFFRPHAATHQVAIWLNLSENDKQIFRAVAHRLWREILAENTATLEANLRSLEGQQT